MGKVQLALVAWRHRRELLMAAAVLVLLPFLLIGAVSGAFISGVPLIPDYLIPLYQRASDELIAPDGSKIPLAWQALVSLDAVRYRQDWNQVTESSTRELAALHIEPMADPGGAPCREGAPNCVCQSTEAGPVCELQPHTRYDRRGDEAVMDLLGFTDEQKRQAFYMGSVDLALLAPCQLFEPNPGSPYVWPATGAISSYFGLRESPTRPGVQEMHWGIDIAADEGTPVRAASDGIVHLAGWAGDHGNLVILSSPEGLHTWYAHLASVTVASGETIPKGAVIGFVGSSGRSTGPHLHFETRPGGGDPVNPVQYYR